MMMLTKECDQKQIKTTSQDPMTEDVTTNSNREQGELMLTYEATTRGFFEIIWITKDSISFSNDRAMEVKKTIACPAEDWNELMELYSTVDINTLPELEAPSKDYQFDGAAMATLKVNANEDEFKTNIFDHGRPPKTILLLVNKVLSMKKIAEKG